MPPSPCPSPHLFLTRFSLVSLSNSSSLPEACDKFQAVPAQGARQSMTEAFPMRMCPRGVLLLLGMWEGRGTTGSGLPCLSHRRSRHWFLENGEKRIFAQMLSTSPNLPLDIEYTGP